MRPTRPVALLWLLVSLWSSSLHLRAALAPPPDRAFAGVFAWIDDAFNYASYAQQASDGHLLFRNKLADPRSARRRLVNLEWLLTGWTSRLCGGRPLLAARLLGIFATLGMTAAAERWLASLGVPLRHRAAALALVLFGGGLGGLLFELTSLPASRCLDVSLAFFPHTGVLLNPHFVVGTALLASTLWCFVALPSPRGPLLGVALGTVLGLVRPYDLVTLGAVRGAAVLIGEPPRRWLRSLLPLCGLLPVLAYDVWVFLGVEDFSSFRHGTAFPRATDFLPALAPAALLAAAGCRVALRQPMARPAILHLALWAAAGFVVIAARPGAFSLQFLVGLGLPLLLLGAAALPARSTAVGWLLVLAMSTTAVVRTRIALADDPNWFVPRERLAAGRAVAASCAGGGRLLAPPDISLYALGHSACHAFVAHPAAPDFGLHLAAAVAFYGQMLPAERAAMLDREGVTVLVLPVDAGDVPRSWLGADTTFRAAARVRAVDSWITVYRRLPAAGHDRSV